MTKPFDLDAACKAALERIETRITLSYNHALNIQHWMKYAYHEMYMRRRHAEYKLDKIRAEKRMFL